MNSLLKPDELVGEVSNDDCAILPYISISWRISAKGPHLDESAELAPDRVRFDNPERFGAFDACKSEEM